MPVYGVAPGPFVEGAVSVAEPVAGSIGVPSLAAHPVETAFVFSGGGNRGACQVGMLRALCERGIVPDLVVGSSIGAVNAAFFAGEPTLEGTYLAAEMWRAVATNDVFPKGRLHGCRGVSSSDARPSTRSRDCGGS
jgi:predicted acylesterase/phospholipase RssA